MNPPTRCRMCLAQCENDELKSMLTTCSNDSINLWTMYDFIMNVGENIDHPSIPYSCMKCKNDLKTAYEFKTMCVETEKALSGLAANDQNIKCELKNDSGACNDDVYLDYSIEENKMKVEISDERITENISCNDSDSSDNVEADKYEDDPESSENGSIEENREVRGAKQKVITDKNARTKQVNTLADKSTKSEQIPPKCKACNLQFDRMKDYRAHYAKLHKKTYKRITHKDRPRTCHACKITFENQPLYQAHYRQYHQRSVQADKDDPARKVICTICGKLFGKRTIAIHIQKMHSNEPSQEHICQVCGKRFKWIANLKLHTRIHEDNKRYACKICGEKFLHWSARQSHTISKHTGEKNYECHICHQKFTQSSNLNTHILRHQNELPHKCCTCPKRFTSTEELLKHEIGHLKDKNLICELCTGVFRSRRTLRNHMKTHSGDRNHLCLMCDKRFASVHSLRRHSKKHSGVEVPGRATKSPF